MKKNLRRKLGLGLFDCRIPNKGISSNVNYTFVKRFKVLYGG